MESNAEFSPDMENETASSEEAAISSTVDEDTSSSLDGGKVRQLIETINRETKCQGIRMWLGVLLTFLLISIFKWYYYSWPSLDFPLLIALVFGPLLVAFLLARPFKRLKAAIEALSQYDDVKAVGPALEYSQYILPRSTKRALRTALTRLLFRVKASDAHLISEKQQRQMLQLLANFLFRSSQMGYRPRWLNSLEDRIMSKTQKANAPLCEAILTALGQVGDESTLATVRFIAEMDARTPDQERVRRAAQACLPPLEERVDRARPGQTLLRPADMEGTENLLRAVQPGASIDTSQLLRSVNEPEA
jgi:hypothetical protein